MKLIHRSDGVLVDFDPQVLLEVFNYAVCEGCENRDGGDCHLYGTFLPIDKLRLRWGHGESDLRVISVYCEGYE